MVTAKQILNVVTDVIGWGADKGRKITYMCTDPDTDVMTVRIEFAKEAQDEKLPAQSDSGGGGCGVGTGDNAGLPEF